MVFLAQALDYLGRNAQQRKHSALRADEIERTIARCLAELSGEERAHIVDPSSHGGKFLEPLSLECRVRENVRRYCGPMVGRHRIDAASDLQYVTQAGIGAVLVLTDHGQCAGALAIQTQILG